MKFYSICSLLLTTLSFSAFPSFSVSPSLLLSLFSPILVGPPPPEAPSCKTAAARSSFLQDRRCRGQRSLLIGPPPPPKLPSCRTTPATRLLENLGMRALMENGFFLVIVRKAKNWYTWKGFGAIPAALQVLKGNFEFADMSPLKKAKFQ